MNITEIDIRTELENIQLSLSKLYQKLNPVSWTIDPCPFCKGNINHFTSYREPSTKKIVLVIKCEPCRLTMTELSNNDPIEIMKAKTTLLKRWNFKA